MGKSSFPLISNANRAQELTALPLRRTVQAPQISMSQDLFVPVRPNRSRRKSMSSSLARTSDWRSWPLTRKRTGSNDPLIGFSPESRFSPDIIEIGHAESGSSRSVFYIPRSPKVIQGIAEERSLLCGLFSLGHDFLSRSSAETFFNLLGPDRSRTDASYNKTEVLTAP